MKQRGIGENCKGLKWDECEAEGNTRDEGEAVSGGKAKGLVGSLKTLSFILRAAGSH